ncbi:MAG: YgiT-type zinc finger protein [Anaerolineaceae bacterium]|nr:YgiT-type zinc finger protein [Anaerolineaceae bacterium]
MSTHCRACIGGKLKQKVITYHTWLGDELITVQDFPAWFCDLCGRYEYEMHAISHLSLMLSPNAGSPTIKRVAISPIKDDSLEPTSTSPEQ